MSSQGNGPKLFYCIRDSKQLKFALGQKNDLVRHTNVVLIFDGTPKFTFDFGTNRKLESKATLCYDTPARVEINSFDPNAIEIKCDIETFDIQIESQDDKAFNLIKVLQEMPMECYNLIENNCRDYTIASFIVIKTFASENLVNIKWDVIKSALKDSKIHLKHSDEEFMQIMRQIKKEDFIKLKTVAAGVSGVGGAILGGTGAFAATGSAAAAGLIGVAGCAAGGAFGVAALAVALPVLKKLKENQD